MICVICKNGETETGFGTITMTRGSTTLVVKNAPALVCDNCGEEYFESDVTASLMDMAEKAENAGVEIGVRNYTIEQEMPNHSGIEDWATEMINTLDIPKGSYKVVEKLNGYQLEHPDKKKPYVFGYVGLDQDGQCTMYAYRDFWDPECRFQRQLSGNNFRYTFNSNDKDAMKYALRAVRSSFDRSR